MSTARENVARTGPADAEPSCGDGPPLRIGVITFSFAPLLTGIATGAQSRVRRLLERGHSVLLIHPAINESLSASLEAAGLPGLREFQNHPRFESVAFPTRPMRFRKSHPEPVSHHRWSVLDPLQRFDADVVIVEEPAGLRGVASIVGGYGRPMGPEFRAATGRPVVGILHTDWLGFGERVVGRWPIQLMAKVIRPQMRRGSQQFTRLVAPSHYLTDKLNAFVDVGVEYLACHGLDCWEFHPAKIACNPIPDFDGPVLLNSGRIVTEKSLPVLLNAFELIQRRIPKVRMYVLGEGELRSRLAADAQRRFGDRVQFPGEKHGDELAGWYARADVYLVASESENFCSANLEALASGTPVVAVAAGGNVEQVIDGETGYLVEPRNPAQMADRSVQLLQEDELRTLMSSAARQFALQYDAPLCTDRLLELLHQLIETNNSSGSFEQQGCVCREAAAH